MLRGGRPDARRVGPRARSPGPGDRLCVGSVAPRFAIHARRPVRVGGDNAVRARAGCGDAIGSLPASAWAGGQDSGSRVEWAADSLVRHPRVNESGRGGGDSPRSPSAWPLLCGRRVHGVTPFDRSGPACIRSAWPHVRSAKPLDLRRQGIRYVSDCVPPLREPSISAKPRQYDQ